MKETATSANYYPEESETKIKSKDKTVKISMSETPVSEIDLELSRYKKTEVKKRVVAHVPKGDR